MDKIAEQLLPEEVELHSAAPRPAARIPLNPDRYTGILSLSLVLATLAFYNPIARNHFIDYDDLDYIVENRYIRSGLNWNTVKWAFTTFRVGNWHPITWLSHALDYQLFHLNPVGHHYTTLLMHAANAVLLFVILKRATRLTWQSWLVSALFALHPINVESVAWIAERKNVLSMLFCFLAFYAYERYVDSGKRVLYAAVAVLFALGLMAKPQIVTFPLVLLLFDYWPLGRIANTRPAANSANLARPLGALIWEKVPLLVLALADSIVTMVAQRSGSAVKSLSEISLSARLENCFVSYARYLGKAFWPSNLALMYPHPGNSLPLWQFLAALAILILVSSLVLYWRDRPYLVVGWLWFLGTLVPMIGIITVGEQAMADRYAYLSFIGLFIAIVWSVGDLAAKYKIANGWRVSSAFVALVILGSLTYRQLPHWFDEETIWRYTLSVTQRNYVAHNTLALTLAKKGRTDEAIPHFQAARELHTYPPDQIVKLAVLEVRVGIPTEALRDCAAALNASSDPKIRQVAFSQMGLAFLELRRYDEAAKSYRNALNLDPDDEWSLVGSGIVALQARNFPLAYTQFSHAAQANASPTSYLLLAQALRRGGQPADADRALAQAQRLSPNLTQPQKDAAAFLSLAGLELL